MSRKLFLVTALIGLVGLLGGVGAPLAAAVSLPVTATTIEGTLSVLWVDYQDGSSQTRFQLTTADGQTVELLPGSLEPAAWLALSGQTVIVSARAASPAEAQAATGEFPALTVVSLEVVTPNADSTGMLTPTVPVLGHTRWVSIGCKFADRLSEEHPLSYFDAMYANTFPGLNHYWREVSADHVWLDDSHAIGWYILPKPYAGYLNDHGSFISSLFEADCLAAADADIYFPDYYGINMIVNDDDLDYAQGGFLSRTLDGLTRRWGLTWMTQWTHKWVSEFEHEMGHGYGLWHSYVNFVPGSYRNIWDVMSQDEYNCQLFSDPVYGCYGQHTIARNKAYLGWIESNRVYVANAPSQTVTLERSALPSATGYLMVEIPISGSITHYYTLEARQLVGYDAKLRAAGVIIHEMGVPPHMFDLIIDGRSDGPVENPTSWWSPGETFNAVEGGISVHIDAATSTGFVVTIRTGLRPASLTLTPTDDTTVRRASPNTNYGGEVTLMAEPKDTTGWVSTRAVLKFDSRQIPTTAYRLTFRLRALQDSGATIPNNLYWASPNYSHTDTPWTEMGLVWNNYAYTLRPMTSLVPPERSGQDVAWDVTGGVALFGSPSFALGGGDATGPVSYSSKEGATPPQLVIDYLIPPTTTTTFLPTNDATVNQAKPKLVLGAKPTLQVKDAAKDLNAYVKFNVTGLTGTLRSATLRLYVLDAGPDGGRVYAASPYYRNTTTQWLETGLNWNTAPTIQGAPLATLGPVALGQWVTADVTAAVAAALTSGTRVSLALSNDSANLVSYSSGEGAQPPELVVVTE